MITFDKLLYTPKIIKYFILFEYKSSLVTYGCIDWLIYWQIG